MADSRGMSTAVAKEVSVMVEVDVLMVAVVRKTPSQWRSLLNVV
jgi:hypothetical protein